MKENLYKITIHVENAKGEEILRYISDEFTEEDRARLLNYLLSIDSKVENED